MGDGRVVCIKNEKIIVAPVAKCFQPFQSLLFCLIFRQQSFLKALVEAING